jgi:hypothetical protein
LRCVPGACEFKRRPRELNPLRQRGINSQRLRLPIKAAGH